MIEVLFVDGPLDGQILAHPGEGPELVGTSIVATYTRPEDFAFLWDPTVDPQGEMPFRRFYYEVRVNPLDDGPAFIAVPEPWQQPWSFSPKDARGDIGPLPL